MLIEAHWIRAYVDGLVRDIYKILKKYPEDLRNPELLDRAFRSTVPVKVQKRDLILKKTSVIVTKAGMLNGVPTLYYLSRLYKNHKSKILLTSHHFEGTNVRLDLSIDLLKQKKMSQ